MSDNSDTPRPRPRPPNAQQGQRRRRPAPKPQESRLIGYIVLGGGVIAIIAVLMMAFSGKPKQAPPVSTVSTQTAPAAPVDAQVLAKDLVDPALLKPPAPKPEVKIKRQPDIDASDMEGSWQAGIGKFTAALQLQKGTYLLIMAQPDLRAARFYSSGTYKTLEDIVVLSPRLDWPAPTPPPGANVKYESLTSAPFPLLAAFQKGSMIWHNPPQSETRVLVPYKTPLTAGEPVDYIVWQRLK